MGDVKIGTANFLRDLSLLSWSFDSFIFSLQHELEERAEPPN